MFASVCVSKWAFVGSPLDEDSDISANAPPRLHYVVVPFTEIVPPTAYPLLPLSGLYSAAFRIVY